MKTRPLPAILLPLTLAAILAACSTAPPVSSSRSVSSGAGSVSRGQLYREVNVKKYYIRRGTYGRKYHRSMRPRYITVHSTQNYSGDAWDHARARCATASCARASAAAATASVT